MRPIQWYLKQRWTHTTHGLHHLIFVNRDLVHSLWWLDRSHLSQGMSFTFPNTTITITTDASMEGWGSECDDYEDASKTEETTQVSSEKEDYQAKDYQDIEEGSRTHAQCE